MNVARLAALILGKPVKKDQLFQFAAIFTVIDFVVFESGIFPKIPPIPVAWQLLVLAPALLFVLVKQSLSLVRFPREPNALFSYGVSFEQRKACVIFHVKQQSSNLMLFISLCYGLLIIGELCFARSNFKALSLVIFLCGYGEVKALEWTLTTIVSGGLLHPTAKDRALRGQWGLGNIQWRRLSIAAIEAVSRQSTRFLGNPVRAVSRRQLLYFMHGDLFASIAVPLGGVALSALACAMLGNSRYQVSDLINVIFPFALLAMNAESAMASAQKIMRCSYYTITKRDFFIANAVVAALFCLPFTIMFLATGNSGPVFPRGVFRTINFLSTQSFLVAGAGQWYSSMASSSEVRFAGVFFWGFPLIALLGIMIPYYGALFPCSMLAALYFLARGDLNRREAL